MLTNEQYSPSINCFSLTYRFRKIGFITRKQFEKPDTNIARRNA
jgi:hypothetical protein